MRILHVVNSLDPGGMENGVVNLSRGLEKKGIESHVACLARRGAFADRLPASVQVLELHKGGSFSIQATWNLFRLISKLKPNVIHTHNLGPLIYAGLATISGMRTPIFHGEHSQLTEDEKSPRRLLQRRRLYRGCRRIHTVSLMLLDELIHLGFSKEKLVSIANGVDTDYFRPSDKLAARKEHHLPATAFLIGLVARFGPYKRHILLIEALEQIAAKVPDAQLLFVGGGGSEETRVRQRVAESPVRDRIHFMGFQQDPRRGYHALDLLAIPSINEGMSNAALEAMACGIPVLANAHRGQEEIITHQRDGFIADLRNIDELAGQIRSIADNRASLALIGQQARERIETAFSLDRMLREYQHYYQLTASKGT